MKRAVGILVCLVIVLLNVVGCGKIETVAKAEAKTGVETKTEINEEQEKEIDPKDAGEEDDVVVQEGEIERIKIESSAIAENKLEEKIEQNLYIYLPPSYQTGDKEYPVVYFLHGFGDSPSVFIRNAKKVLDKEFTKDASKEFLLVAVDGSNSVGGSFYVNSPVMGNWETYTVSEVVSYIDSNYHTISEAGARGICGFSMGGFASINLAFRHPDVYSAVYAMSPGLLAPGKIKEALETWEGDQIFLEAYSMAFAYKDQAPYIEIPSGDGTEVDQILMERWESGFGNLQEKLDDYLALGVPLKSIGFCYGENDGYQWIPEGTRY
ncbi:MAG: alpha/beta hydrolase-fold protein [Lachnospiraceae bacterium]|nr:alpha/beta hydrolase-fold protein [Lachnospiraceae bacterium]